MVAASDAEKDLSALQAALPLICMMVGGSPACGTIDDAAVTVSRLVGPAEASAVAALGGFPPRLGGQPLRVFDEAVQSVDTMLQKLQPTGNEYSHLVRCVVPSSWIQLIHDAGGYVIDDLLDGTYQIIDEVLFNGLLLDVPTLSPLG